MIHHSSQLIGAAAAFRLSQEESNTYLKKATHENWLRVRTKILTVMRFGGGLRAKKRNDVAQASLSSGKRSRRRSSLVRLHEKSVELRSNFKATALKAKDNAHTKANRWVAKMHGGNAGETLLNFIHLVSFKYTHSLDLVQGIPPSFTWTQTIWSFFGVLATHSILSRLNYFIMTETADTSKLSLVLAPLGALTTLQYNLTPAPASQPRNAFFAQVFAITVAALISYIPFTAENAWFRSALAPAIVIPFMAKLGITVSS